jgi:hypothetical protein
VGNRTSSYESTLRAA